MPTPVVSKTSSFRRLAQFAINYPFFSNSSPGILINSIPKSGTHLLKSLLLCNGLKYGGHLSEYECQLVRHKRRLDKNSFLTAHISKFTAFNPDMTYVFLYRNPIDVMVSMAHYIKSRPDHPRHANFCTVKISILDLIHKLCEGQDIGESIDTRYKSMMTWSETTKSLNIDFQNIKNNPRSLFVKLNLDCAASPDVLLTSSINKWSPTKRKYNPYDAELKEALKQNPNRYLQNALSIYQEIKSLPQNGSN